MSYDLSWPHFRFSVPSDGLSGRKSTRLSSSEASIHQVQNGHEDVRLRIRRCVWAE